MQINRLFEIVYILLNKKTTTAKELAERFEVSVRTIYRDIDTLSSAGIPIYASQGKGGGISLLDDYILNKSVLSENEQNEILFALQSLTVTQNPETDRVLSKLSSLFNKNKINWIEVDLSPWGSDKTKTCEFTILKNAILNHQVIELNYFNAAGEKSSRKVEPVKLLFKVKAWYMKGFCLSKNEYRTFKISRMSDVRIRPEIFADRLPKELPEDTKEQSSQMWINVQLRISPHRAYRVFDEFNEKEITKNQDGSFTIATALPESEWLFNYILSFGVDVEVLTPQNIRERIQNKLEEILGKYKDKKS
ncbi:MAG TPA: YafY family protein [Desulfosporosinus sp.]|nr:YafY family protein [Desulfosporosinus sp.]